MADEGERADLGPKRFRNGVIQIPDAHPVGDHAKRIMIGGKRDAADDADIPVPALIDVRFEGPPSANALKLVQQNLRRIAPSVRIDSHASWMAPFVALMQTLFLLALSVMLLLLASSRQPFGSS